jgi:hypothetical protein
VKRAWIAVLVAAAASPAMAADRELLTLWKVDVGTAEPTELEVGPGDFVIKQRLLPTGLVELGPEAGRAGIEGIAEGKQLVEVRSAGAAVYCDPVLRAQKLIGHAQPCFVDADFDGRFEGLFRTTSVTKGILTVQGQRPKTPKSIPPISYRQVDPATFGQKLFVGIEYGGGSVLGANYVFSVSYGSTQQTGSLTGEIVHKKEDVPGVQNAMGGRFTILAATPRGLRVRVDQPIPSDTFSVVQTTTYRIY